LVERTEHIDEVEAKVALRKGGASHALRLFGNRVMSFWAE
jgi:hypothetical protein